MFGSHWHSGISSRLVFFSNKIQVFNDNEEFKIGFNDTKGNYVGNITRVERADYFGFDYPWFLWIFVKSGTYTSALGKKDIFGQKTTIWPLTLTSDPCIHICNL